MKTSFWNRVRGGSAGVRILSTYVAFVLMLAIAGPGLAVYAADEGSPEGIASEVVPPVEIVPAEIPAEDPVLTPELVAPEPVIEMPVVPEASIDMPMAAAESLVPMVLAAPNEPNPNSLICAGGVKLDGNPRTGTYTPATSGTEETPTTPTDYVISITTYEAPGGLGMLMDFESNYPVSEVIVKGGTDSLSYVYDPPVFSGVGLHTPVNPNNGKYFDISHIVFCFGELPPELVDLTVYKFEDLNSNGVFDDEPMLAGWEFTLYDSEDAVVASGITDASGALVFSDLMPGDYHVIETLIPGWTSTTGLTLPITLPSETPSLYFGNIGEEQPPELVDLTVYKFEDLNSNGVFDDEPMLAGWEFTLYDSEDAVVASGITDASGALVFSDLLPGDYHVIETLIPGWTSTTGLTMPITLPSETPRLYFGNIEESLPFTELDLAITKVADKATAGEGELITYTLTYRNLGDLAAENYTIVDDFDERYVTIVTSAGGTVAGGKITWSFAGPLSKSDGPKTLIYTVRVIADMPEGTTNVDNIVVISHPRDENITNNSAAERVVVRVAGEPFLPFTGGEYLLLIVFAVVAAALGLTLRLRTVDLA